MGNSQGGRGGACGAGATLDAQGRTQPYAYTAFGVPLTYAQHPVFGVAGELHDPLSGLVSLRARWYDPDSGTLLTTDPYHGGWQQPYGHHPYQYVYSNPLRFADPSGMLAISVHGAYGQQDVSPSISMYFIVLQLENSAFTEGELILTGPEGDYPGMGWQPEPRIRAYAEKIIESHCREEKVTLYGNSRGAVFLQRVIDEAMLVALEQGIPPSPEMVDLFVSIAPIHSPDTPASMTPYNQKRSIVTRQVNILSEYGWVTPVDLRPHKLGNTWMTSLLLPLRTQMYRDMNVFIPEIRVYGAENIVFEGTWHNGLITEKNTLPIATPTIPDGKPRDWMMSYGGSRAMGVSIPYSRFLPDLWITDEIYPSPVIEKINRVTVETFRAK